MKFLTTKKLSKIKFTVLIIIFCGILYYQVNLPLKEENNLLEIINLTNNIKFYRYKKEDDKRVRNKWIIINTKKGVNITKNIHPNNMKNSFILNINDVIYEDQSHFLSTSYEFKRNITLLVTFNLKIFEQNIPTLVHIYRSFFRNIAFCGANLVNIFHQLRGRDRELFDSYTFIEFDSDNRFYHYHCMTKAAQMNYNTDGVLLASDDVVFKTCHMKSLNSSRIWYSQKLEPNAQVNLKGFSS